MQHVAVLGGGSFGTALAQHLARRGQQVRLWVRDAAQAEAIGATRRNPHYLSDFVLHDSITASADMAVALAGSQWVVSAMTSASLRSALCLARPHLRDQILVIGTKGIEDDTLFTMDTVACDVLGADYQAKIVALSGPSFAREIMQERPTAVVLASHHEALAQRIAPLFFCDTFRAYCTDDVIGVELGGALKNVMAIAAGAISGLGLGENARAAMITRGLAEMTRLSVAQGGHVLTMLGLAGVGDLVMTCTGGLSRNRAVGEALGQGKPVEEAIASVHQVAEGVRTALAARRLSERVNVDAPIIHAVYRVLYEKLAIRDAVLELVRREPGRELF